jgi:hypothetical protein
MKTDTRLRAHHPGETLHRQAAETKRRALDKSVSEEAWQTLIAPLSDLVVARIEGGANPSAVYPTDGDARFREDFEHVRGLILEDRPVHCKGDLGHLLIQRLAALLAVRLPGGVAQWTKAAAFFKVSANWASFLESIPAEKIESWSGELIDCKLPLSDCFDGVDVTLNQLAATASGDEKDPLEKLWERKRMADYCRLSHKCEVRSVLLSRLPPTNWLHWLEGLPHPAIQLVALNTVKDLDFLETILGEMTLGRPSVRSDDLLFLSVVWRMIRLWEDIDDGIDQMIRQKFDESKEFKNQWESDDLPKRVKGLVTLLESSKEGLEVASLLLRHISPYRGPRFEILASRDQLRDELLSLFERREMELEATGLLRRPTVTSLTAAAVLAIRRPNAERLNTVLRNYEKWLAHADYVWYQKFEAHDKELLETLSDVLARSVEQLAVARSLIDAIREPAQGWKFDYTLWLRSVSRLSHALVVVSLAAVRTAADEGRGEKSSDLMDLAWNEFHSIIEHGLAEPRRDELASPLEYVWSCAGKTFDGGDDEIIRAIRIFGHPELVLCAACNLAAHGGLSEKTKLVVKEEMDHLIEFYRRDRKFSTDDEARTRKELGKLVVRNKA